MFQRAMKKPRANCKHGAFGLPTGGGWARPPSSFDRLRTPDGQGRLDHFESGVGRERCQILPAPAMEDGPAIACGHSDGRLATFDSHVGTQPIPLAVVPDVACARTIS